MQNIKIIIEYDGTDFFGWQKQPNLRTVQGTIESALFKILQEEVKIIGASRTDRGVHAEAQVTNFFTDKGIESDILFYRLNKVLPKDIKIKTIEEVDGNFHARYNAKSKLYRYTILNGKIASPLFRFYSWHIPAKLNISKIRVAKKILVGTHNFRFFSTSGNSSENFVRNIKKITLKKEDKFIYIFVEGEGFLKNMVRYIVATLVEIGKGKIEISDIKKMLECKERKITKSAPAHGLCLVKVDY